MCFDFHSELYAVINAESVRRFPLLSFQKKNWVTEVKGYAKKTPTDPWHMAGIKSQWIHPVSDLHLLH